MSLNSKHSIICSLKIIDINVTEQIWLPDEKFI